MPGIAAVHLVRRQNGLAPFERFLASYRKHAAGAAHELVILFKGFRGEQETEGHDRLIEGLAHRRMFVSDQGFDLNAYFHAAAQLDYDYFCFLNSYSQILCQGWLEKMSRWAADAGVGLVGATGSYQSIATGHLDHMRYMQSLPVTKRIQVSAKRMLAEPLVGAFARRAVNWSLRRVGVWNPTRDFPLFPNRHLRTNAFMGARQTLRRVYLGPMRIKLSAYKFESGKDSLTNQVLRMGLKVLVVGRDGEGYEPERWHLSNTFWQSREENLLVADNQTEFYLAADPETRAERARYAWGEFARPA
jgi:hypothetical protein